ncbi:Pkinase-domain-containing protein, partial [Piedraia hortae CBS 480.64]
MFQLLTGLLYLHQSWVMHRDLKPANIMVTSQGQVKIGDLGLARIFRQPLQPLSTGDKVVVTVWYRAPELILGTRHYTPAIDLWAVGCIFAELISLRPIFKGEEAKQDGKKSVPFQTHQMAKIAEILGLPRASEWSLLTAMPEYTQLNEVALQYPSVVKPMGLEKWFSETVEDNNYGDNAPEDTALDLLKSLLTYDPMRRITAEEALAHPYFASFHVNGEDLGSPRNCFHGIDMRYPARRVSSES